MIGLDTNIVIRYLVQDDPKQSKLANEFIEDSQKSKEGFWISQITLCEIFWVLEKRYKISKTNMILILTNLLETAQIQIENEVIAWEALNDYEKSSKVSFADCMIGRQNAFNDCAITYTLDKYAAKRLPKIYKLLA